MEKYGFMGVDIDLEGDSIRAGDNAAVITEVLVEMRTEYALNNKPFFITLAPEFHTLRGPDALYKPILDGLGGCWDLIFPQYYNQGLDGIWSSEMGMWLASNDDARKSEFIYYLTRAIISGESDFIKIPANKLCVGLPASPISALNGYVSDPLDVIWALERLEAEGSRIRGLMTWSVNQDAANGYEFIIWYSPYVYS
jgi:chitinase